MRFRSTLIAVATSAALAGVVLLPDDGSDTPRTRAASERPLGAGHSQRELRSCHERVEGAPLKPERARDTVIGPAAFLGAAGAQRDYASRPDSELEPYPNLGMPAMKVLVLLRAGARVTLAIPREQRRWMKLVYGRGQRGEHAIALQAEGALPRGGQGAANAYGARRAPAARATPSSPAGSAWTSSGRRSAASARSCSRGSRAPTVRYENVCSARPGTRAALPGAGVRGAARAPRGGRRPAPSRGCSVDGARA